MVGFIFFSLVFGVTIALAALVAACVEAGFGKRPAFAPDDGTERASRNSPPSTIRALWSPSVRPPSISSAPTLDFSIAPPVPGVAPGAAADREAHFDSGRLSLASSAFARGAARR